MFLLKNYSQAGRKSGFTITAHQRDIREKTEAVCVMGEVESQDFKKCDYFTFNSQWNQKIWAAFDRYTSFFWIIHKMS